RGWYAVACLLHVGEHDVVERQWRNRPRGIDDRCRRTDQQRALLAKVAGFENGLICGQRRWIALWPGEQVMCREDLVDVAAQRNPAADEDDEVVADTFQVGDEVRREDD